MRKMRFLVVALIAVLGIASVAYAQSNSYTISAKVPAGGSKKKPKIGGFSFGYTVTDPSGNVPAVVETYSLGIEGSVVNTKVAPACAAAKINAAGGDSGCSSKALIGTGTVEALVGTTGTSASQASKCTLTLHVYNGGTNKAALYLNAGTDTCVAPISEAFEGKWVKKDGGTALVFTVPEDLRHQLGLDLPVVSVTTKFKKIQKTIKGKKVGYFESIGCKDKVRTATGTFTDESGNSVPVTKDIGKC